MRKYFVLLLLLFVCGGVSFAQTMTDEEVISYVMESQSKGMAQTDIVKNLLRRGVTMDQVNRIKAKYGEGGNEVVGDNTTAKKVRTRNKPTKGTARDNMLKDADGKSVVSSKEGGFSSMGELSEEEMMLEGLSFAMQDSTDMEKEPEPKNKKEIFGHRIFKNKSLSFEPNLNIATPANYRMGPGDEVIIDIWGDSQTTIQETISPDGAIQVEGYGPLYLNGMTIKEANGYVQSELGRIYGISGDDPSSQIKITLGQIRTIQVNVMGEVENPGTYTLSSFATVFHALYQAGGMNEIGTMRAVKVYRANKLIATLDIYDYILNGQMQGDIRLVDDDVIMVGTYESLVNVVGKVKRPMYYEMKRDENLATVLQYAGGFAGDAYKKSVRLIRKGMREQQIYNVDEADFSSFVVLDGDSLNIDSALTRFSNMVEVKGAVYRTGMYQMDGRINTVRALIEAADGITPDAFVNRAVLHRKGEDFSLEIIPVDVKGIMAGTAADITLRNEDVLFIPTVMDVQEERQLSIHGEVNYPGTYMFAANTTLEDLVLQAGGLKDAASVVRVEVARRIKDASGQPGETAKTFTFSLRDGFVVSGESGFVLEPFDEVYVRRSPGYQEQQHVTVEGEVLYPGKYVMVKKNYRLSELLNAAGGVTDEAFVKGAQLVRKYTPEEIEVLKRELRFAKLNAEEDPTAARTGMGKSLDEIKDSIDLEIMELCMDYRVAIELDKALANPGSTYDPVLREGDHIVIPQYVNTVKILGSVNQPNAVTFVEGEKIDYYIEQAGGYAQKAWKKRAYVVYANGTMAKVKGGGKNVIQPGCKVIVPEKNGKTGLKTSEILSIGTTTASLATMVATVLLNR
ncbi:MAG: SLBB domain-containing protein [Bacteroidaceae bacterium]|nr:SLBB domain-containing protein [Bacteroidaceae bacterium]